MHWIDAMKLLAPLLTPEELHCLLGWPLPEARNEALGKPTALGSSTPGPAQSPAPTPMAERPTVERPMIELPLAA